MSSLKSFNPLQKIEKAAISRWKLETLTGLLGIRSLQNHQAETEKNIAAENRHVRKSVWGESDEQSTGEPMAGGQTILGDNIHPAPIIIGQQPSGGGLAKTLAGIAIGAMIPAAGLGGFVANKLINPAAAPAPAEVKPADGEKVDLGLLRFEDLQKSQ